MNKSDILEWGRLVPRTEHLVTVPGGSDNAALDFSAIPETFSWGPAEGETVTVTKLTVNIQDLNIQAARYGGVSALTNGFYFEVTNTVGAAALRISEFTQAIKSNFDLLTDFADNSTAIVNFAVGDDILAAHLELWKDGLFITLDGSKGERVSATLNDDFSGLSRHEFVVSYKIHKDF